MGVYAPIIKSEEENKLAFYFSLSEIIQDRVPSDSEVIIFGDIKACIGVE